MKGERRKVRGERLQITDYRVQMTELFALLIKLKQSDDR